MSQARDADRNIELEAVEDLQGVRVPPETYHAVFVRDPQGRAVLEDLVMRFHDRELFVPGGRAGERETAIRMGERRAVGFILRRIGQIRVPDVDTKKG